MLFDRYEIHIQASVHFINGKLIIVQSSSPEEYFEKYILNMIPTTIFWKSQNIFRKNNGFAFQKH